MPLSILLLPTENILVVPASFINSFIPLTLPEPSWVLFVVVTLSPLRAAIRPRQSITALSATSAKEGS